VNAGAQRLGLLVLAATLAGCASTTPLERGLGLYDQGYYAAAVAAFDEAVVQSPRSVAAWTNRGVARIRLGDVEGAISDFSRALELSPDDSELLFNRGNAQVTAGNLPAAIADFTRATEVRPTFTRAFFNRGIARSRAGDPEGARVDFARAIDLEPDPRVRARLRQAASVHAESAAPAGTGPASLTASPPSSAEPEPPGASPPGGPALLDARALADRGLNRELSGDHDGALADLRAALAVEGDPHRRQGLEALLQLLEADR
jgi:tetratricopeptide (TPR) repeat protein